MTQELCHIGKHISYTVDGTYYIIYIILTKNVYVLTDSWTDNFNSGTHYLSFYIQM